MRGNVSRNDFLCLLNRGTSVAMQFPLVPKIKHSFVSTHAITKRVILLLRRQDVVWIARTMSRVFPWEKERKRERGEGIHANLTRAINNHRVHVFFMYSRGRLVTCESTIHYHWIAAAQEGSSFINERSQTRDNSYLHPAYKKNT